MNFDLSEAKILDVLVQLFLKHAKIVDFRCPENIKYFHEMDAA